MKILTVIIFTLIASHTMCQYPPGVTQALAQTNNNKEELKYALNYFYKSGDSLKIKSINFLVENMPIHSSYSYFWADSLGKQISFNELDYPSYKQAIESFEILKASHGKLHPQSYIYRDVDSIKKEMLIDNVELAVKKYREQKLTSVISTNDFLNYILPYRVSVEPLQNWRGAYVNKFEKIIDITAPRDSQLIYIGKDIKKWFLNTYGIETRKEPLPRLGALQLINRQKGGCEDIADLAALMLRSQGILATCDMVTFWGTSSGSHFCNGTYATDGQPIRFDASTSTPRITKFEREPAKVIRTTYSNQHETIANLLPAGEIPPGFMRYKNYVDVTDLYWPVDSLKVSVFDELKNSKFIYCAVYNGGTWQPTWWTKNTKGNYIFNKMSKGVIYLPMIYKNNKALPAGWPVALGYNNRMQLKPNSNNLISITIPEKSGHLIFRPKKNYTLYIWDNKWVKHSMQVANDGCKQLIFEKIPSNALYLLLPEYTKFKERPFLVDEKGEIHYF